MRLKIFFIIILGVIWLSGKAQYQIPLFAPGNTGGSSGSNDNSVLMVAGQNVIGTTQDNNYTAYFGLLAPIAMYITDVEVLSKPNSRLMQNYPNPYRKYTTIPFELIKQEKIILIVTDIMGRPVKTLLNQVMPPGTHNIGFNADYLTPGFYLYQLKIDGQILVKTMAVSK